MEGRRWNRLLWFVGGLLSLLPLSWLLPLRADSQCDWFSHVWVLNQVAESFRHGALPWTLNSDGLVGVPWLEHYGQWFYGPLGLVSWLWDARLSFKVAALLLALGQYAAISGSLRAHGLRPSLALLVSLILAWATYPMTNLLNRGALPEYFASGEALMALAVLVWSLAPDLRDARRRLLVGLFWFLLALVFGTHPITALYTGLLLGLLVPALCLDRDLRRALLEGGRLHPPFIACFLLCSAAWLYLVLGDVSQLAVLEKGGLQAYSPALDSWAVRFWPLPRGLGPGDGSRVPYLDPQVCLPLLGLALGALVIHRRLSLAIVALLLLLGLFAVLSCTAEGMRLLPEPFQALQYRYRLVNQLNALGFVLVLFALRRGDHPRPRTPVLIRLACGGLLLWSAVSMLQRGQRGSATRQEAMIPSLLRDSAAARRSLEYRNYCYGLPDYAWVYRYGVVDGKEEPGRSLLNGLRLPVNAEPVYASVGGIRFQTDVPVWGRSNVLAHPWNRLLLDGRPVEDKDLRIDRAGLNCFLVRLEPGRHTLAYVFEPDPMWQVLFWIGVAVLSGWVFWLSWLGFRQPE